MSVQSMPDKACSVFIYFKNFGNFIPIASSYENKLKTG